MNEEPLLENHLLEGLMKTGSLKFVCEMIDIFLAYIPGKLEEAQAGLQAGELGTVRAAFHSIKSSVGTIGALTLKDLATQIERLAGEKNGESIPALFVEFRRAYVQVEKFLQDKRQELGGVAETLDSP